MSTKDLEPSAAIDSSPLLTRALHGFHEWFIEERFRPRGLWGRLCLLGIELVVLGLSVVFALILGTGILRPLLFYWKEDKGDPLIAKALLTLAVVVCLGWTARVSFRSRDRDVVISIMRDFGALLKGNRIKKDSVAYRHLVDKYSSISCSRLDNPIATIKATCFCREQSTQEITRRYRDHGMTASDWLCLIFAKPGTSIGKRSQFGWWLVYFHEFDRRRQPTDRISRVFSTPVRFRRTPEGPSWDSDSRALDLDGRFMLLAYLFINRAVGVDTMLHCFDPQDVLNSDFFHEADYVIVNDPVQNDDNRCEVLFVAIPGNERMCLEVDGKSIWSEVFRAEFYTRLTEGRGGRKGDLIVDATTEKARDLVEALGLEWDALPQKWSEVRDAIKRHSSKFPDFELDRLENRWKEWFKDP